jgi:hypothetical protein
MNTWPPISTWSPAAQQQAFLADIEVVARVQGKQYGYPECCIDYFVTRLLATAPPWEHHLHDGVGGVIDWAAPSLSWGPNSGEDPDCPAGVKHLRCPACRVKQAVE